MFNLSPTDRQLNCCEFRLNLSLRCWFQLKEECESADGYPCIDRCLDLKLIITMAGHITDVWGLDDDVT